MQPYSPYPPDYQPVRPVITEEYIRRNEKSKLRKKSNGVGFYIFAYYATLQILAIVVMMIYSYSGIDMTTMHSAEYMLDILASVASALIPGLIYILASGFDIRNCFGKTSVRPMLLIPIILMGMGVSMAANFAAEIFAQNISIFGLEKVPFHVPVLYMIATGLAILAVALATAGIFGLKVRKINPVEMITEE